jgi:arginase
MLDIIGAPFDYCGKAYGSRLGPAAVRLAGLQQALADVGCEVRDRGDIEVLPEDPCSTGIRNFDAAYHCFSNLKSRTLSSLNEGHTPLVLGGDHSISIGSISAALEVADEGLAVLWIDAHADLNTADTTPSNNLHGMTLGALLGFESSPASENGRQWARILGELVPLDRLRQDRIAWFALRDLDSGERKHLKAMQGHLVATMHDIDRTGIEWNLKRIDAWLRSTGAKKLWISFDVDSMDPNLAPGTGTAVHGGLTYREAHLCAELVREMLDADGCPYKLAGLDLVETNPLRDRHNETAIISVEWIASLFGKTILGRAS